MSGVREEEMMKAVAGALERGFELYDRDGVRIRFKGHALPSLAVRAAVLSEISNGVDPEWILARAFMAGGELVRESIRRTRNGRIANLGTEGIAKAAFEYARAAVPDRSTLDLKAEAPK